MEHRWISRIRLRLEVALRVRGAAAGYGRSVDVSDLGMFVELDPGATAFAPGQVVQVALRHRARPAAWALVVHRRGSGIGIMFSCRDPFGVMTGPDRARAVGVADSRVC